MHGNARAERRGLLERIHHLGYAVEDLEASRRFYETMFGVQTGEPERVEDQDIVASMFRVGESKVELVQPTRADSPVGKFLAKRGEGFHHVAFGVEDLDGILASLRKGGVELIDAEPRVGVAGTRMAFVHPKGAFGVLTELVETPEGTETA
jgi:methylmalonyl-CoA/ethylmalonyl-CoA epimerase